MKFDTGLFIETVKQCPSLYDHQHPDYKDPAKKMRLWHEIACKCAIPTGEMAKAKWRNVRDSYVKHLKSLKIGNPNRKYNAWPWSDRMEFLVPYITGRHNLFDGSFESGNHSSPNPSLFLKQDCWEEPSEFTIPDNGTESMESEQDQQRRIPDQLVTDTSIMERPAQSGMDYLESVKIELSDPTDLMMLSHARRIRGFSRRRQIDIEMKIAQLVMEAEMKELEEEENRSVCPEPS